MNRKLFAKLVAVAVLVVTSKSHAGMVDATAQYQVTLQDACTVSATGADFGAFPTGDVTYFDLDAGVISVTCPDQLNFALGIDCGLGGDPSTRTMSNGQDTVNYHLYAIPGDISNEVTDFGLSVLYPSAGYTEQCTFGSAAVSTGTGVAEDFALYGAIDVLPATPAGTYSDTVTVTIVW